MSGAFTDMDHEVVCVFEIVHCEQEVCEVDTEGYRQLRNVKDELKR